MRNWSVRTPPTFTCRTASELITAHRPKPLLPSSGPFSRVIHSSHPRHTACLFSQFNVLHRQSLQPTAGVSSNILNINRMAIDRHVNMMAIDKFVNSMATNRCVIRIEKHRVWRTSGGLLSREGGGRGGHSCHAWPSSHDHRDPRISTMSGRSTSGFHRPGTHWGEIPAELAKKGRKTADRKSSVLHL